jgi:hypothetical protein
MQPNHEAPVLSTAEASASASPAPSCSTPSEQSNHVLYRAGLAGGHVESLFLKGNSPDGQRALWLKYTLLAPAQSHAPALAELWAIAFDRAHPGGPRANKRSYPIAQAEIRTAPFALRLPDAELRHGAAKGALGFDAQGGPRLAWDVRFACPEQAFRPFPSPRMYTGAFPRTKTLTPVPDTQLEGTFEVDGARWDVSGYRAAQGHNWGKGHAHAYAWAHANALRPAPGSARFERAWFEAISGRVRVGPLLTPWLTCAAIEVDGERFRFDGLRALLSRSVQSDLRSFSFRLRQHNATLTAKLRADEAQLAGLRYADPDGRTLSCLNSKLAQAELTLELPGRTFLLQSDQAALELGTRDPHHGVPMLA